jgi:regulator of ribonuclease activity A
MFNTVDLCDQFSSELEVVQPIFRDFGARRQFSGQAATLKCFEDNSKVRDCVKEPGNGRVLVVDAGGSLRCAMLGDQLAKSAADNGWSGIVMYGCVRDTKQLATFDIGIKALAPMPVRSEKRGEGIRDIAVCIPGATIKPGNWIYADEDGIVVAQRALI